jgi:hypothetical protein
MRLHRLVTTLAVILFQLYLHNAGEYVVPTVVVFLHHQMGTTSTTCTQSHLQTSHARNLTINTHRTLTLQIVASFNTQQYTYAVASQEP